MPAKLMIRFAKEGVDPKHVVEYAKKYGSFEAMEHYHIRDIMSWNRFLKEMGEHEHIGLARRAVDTSPMQKLMAAFATKLARVTAEYERRIEEKDKEIRRLKAQLDLYDSNDSGLMAEVEDIIRDLDSEDAWRKRALAL